MLFKHANQRPELMRFLRTPLLIAALIPASAVAAPVDVAAARQSLVGQWEGRLEYRDYTADKWFGIPVKTAIEDQGDGATIIRKSDFDDGPKVGNVRITTVELYDVAKAVITSGTFRKGRTPELTNYAVRLNGVAADAAHWTMIEETDGMDDNRPARLRLTTVRSGDSLQTLKEVDFLDDKKDEWLARNRTTLTRKS
jgi:hypothetical protein